MAIMVQRAMIVFGSPSFIMREYLCSLTHGYELIRVGVVDAKSLLDHF